MSSAPGWYPDPWKPGRRRWWDGNGWADQTLDPDAPPPPSAFAFAPGPPDPHRELDDERRASVWAKRGFIGMVVGRVIGGLTTVILFNDFIDEVRRSFDTNGRYQPDVRRVQLLSSPASALSFLGMLLVAIWLQRAATVARNLQYPARRTPAWAVVGWFVPVVNFWIPYQCARDCLPPTHPDRRTVKQWWTAYLVGTTLWLVTLVVALVASYGIALAFGLPAVIVSAIELQCALRIVTAIENDHAGAVRRYAA